MFYTPNDKNIVSCTDAKSIQNALDMAAKDGIFEVVIPRINERTGGIIWDIDETIYIPSDMTVILDGCHLRLTDGSFCNMFKNKGFKSENSNDLSGEDKNIYLLGRKGAVLDGGKYNGLSESNSNKDGRPSISVNTMIFFHNIRDFVVDNIKVINMRWWGMTYMFARYGKITNIDFCASAPLENPDGSLDYTKQATCYMNLGIRNTDGIDLRVGCNNILIENITGLCGDDSVALTALLGFETKMLVKGRDTDIHTVTIRNIHTRVIDCANVRLLNSDGNKLYNVMIDGVFDASEHGGEKTTYAVRIGDNIYTHLKNVEHGETYGITVRNVYSRAKYALNITATLINSYFNNIHIYDDSQKIFIGKKDTTLENLVFDGLFMPFANEKNRDAVCDFRGCTLKNVVLKNVVAPNCENIALCDEGNKIDIC